MSQKEVQRVAVISPSWSWAGQSPLPARPGAPAPPTGASPASPAPAPRELKRICCFRHGRTAGNDNVVQWAGRRIQIPPQPHWFRLAGIRVEVYQDLAVRATINHGDSRLQSPTLQGVTLSPGR